MFIIIVNKICILIFAFHAFQPFSLINNFIKRKNLLKFFSYLIITKKEKTAEVGKLVNNLSRFIICFFYYYPALPSTKLLHFFIHKSLKAGGLNHVSSLIFNLVEYKKK